MSGVSKWQKTRSDVKCRGNREKSMYLFGQTLSLNGCICLGKNSTHSIFRCKSGLLELRFAPPETTPLFTASGEYKFEKVTHTFITINLTLISLMDPIDHRNTNQKLISARQ